MQVERRADLGGRSGSGVGGFSSPFAGPLTDRLRFLVVLLLLGICVIGGGASRADVLSLLYLRPAAILCIAVLLFMPGQGDLRRFRILWWMLAGLALVIAIQLIPLPPTLWLSLPGRAHYAEAAAAAGLAQPWRPITLTPDLTWNSLLALIPPLAALYGFAALREDQRAALLPILIGIACVSAIMGIIQITGSANGPAYFYRIRHEGSADGFFANRNHQATLLALGFPMLRMWTLLAPAGGRQRWSRQLVAAAIGLFLISMILVTGSRAGMAMAAVGIVCAYLLAPIERRERARRGKWARISVIAMWAAPVLVAGAAIFFGRALSVERLVGADILLQEQRVQNTPLMIRMVGDFLPFGTGFGSFDPVFRGFEPDSSLGPTYFNRAHNELIELALTGGIPALIVLIAFLIWWGRSSVANFLPYRGRSARAMFARLGAVMILMLFLASLVDYPLRTPLMSVVFAFACGWLVERQKGQRSRDQSP